MDNRAYRSQYRTNCDVNHLSDIKHNQTKRVLVMTAVSAEKEAVLKGLQQSTPHHFDVQLSGVGVAEAAARTAFQLAQNKPYDLVINAGIAGGFARSVHIGDIAIADRIIAADLGAETPQGFISVDELGFGSATISVDAIVRQQIVQALKQKGLNVTSGPVLSVSTVTGTEQTATALTHRITGAVAEAMEGFGVASAAQQCNIPVLEVRTISNVVGDRDRASWRIPEALEKLEQIFTIFPEVLR
ncbi:futalosine hydrolase [Caldalkalibacillus salinus]|uniref:futalosine hydrolase n=1 Tax=Caldalkalibacillus salinus TaxID=2803787 RepID=UPI0019223617|nr:futalosine hydrolase [Caldalkalibacillus salinus]